ncbi:hypothetical protein LCGC14_2314580 [marine sediment metagenome]|uniref:Uncharacterized protein n=1 Tax=marine sediment metagenome TaxID=412755 RepID=A0A0F9D784_9ZZZZ
MSLIKKLLYLVSIPITFASLFISFYIAYEIITKGYNTFIEPNSIMITLEIIWVSIGILMFPLMIRDIIKKELE